MNKWQQFYCDTYYKGKIPNSKNGIAEFELLGNVNEYVTVEFPSFNRFPPHTDRLLVTENDCDILHGRISVSVLISNLKLWQMRGQNVSYE